MKIFNFSQSKEERQKQRIIKKEEKERHIELLKEANKSYKEEKVAPNNSFISLVNVNKIYDNHVQAVYNFI